MSKQKPKTKAGSQKPADPKPEVIHVSTSQLAHLLGVTDRQIRNWVNHMGCPKLAHGLFDLKVVLDWWIESDLIGSRLEVNDESLRDLKAELLRWQIEIARMKAEQTSGTLIPRAEIATQWVGRMREYSSGLEHLKYRLPPRLEGLSQSGMRDIIDKEVWDIRDRLSRVGRFCPVAEEEIRPCENCPCPRGPRSQEADTDHGAEQAQKGPSDG